jgi:hypothetical protein
MKKSLIVGLLSLSMLSANAQDLPKPSPLCTTSQSVGLTNISLEYSRPSVKEREIFGNLVPFDKVWRLGANAPTMLTVDTEIDFDGQKVKPGKYAVFAIPSEKNEWKVVINTDTEQWGAGNYDSEKDVATIKVKPVVNSFTESLSITIENITTNSGSIVIAWAKTKVTVPFTLNTDEFAIKNIETAIEKGEDLEKVYANAAGYYKNSKKDFKTALKYAEKSIQIKETHSAMFLKAQITADQGNKEEAIKIAEKALALAKAAESQGWADYINETLTAWKK